MVTAFVLTGQGSLAAQHVGMLQALARHGVTPDLLLGASAGAPNAAYIAGFGTGPWALRRLAALWTGLGRREMFPALRRSGPATHSLRQRSPASLHRLLRSQLPYVRIEEARIAVHLLARDARTGRGVLLSNGLVVSAVMASCAVPGLLPAVQRKGRTLCDGGPAVGKALRDAVALGARRIVVLSTGTADLVTDPLRPPFFGQQSEDVVAGATGVATLHVVPVPVSPGVTRSDYARAPTLIHAARETANAWLESGGLAGSDIPADRWPAAAAASPDLSGTRSA